MEELICYYNGDFMKASEVKVSMWDMSFTRGAGVYDMARSYKHVPLFWKEHIDRLYRGLHCVHIDPGLTPEQMLSLTCEVFERNKKSLDPEDDFMMAQWVNLGAPTNFFSKPIRPNVLINCLHLSPRYEGFAKNYQEGIHLVVVNTRQIPPQSFDVKVKHTSRWCNELAEFEAKMVDPEALALMLDINGLVAEGPTFNCFMVKDSKLFTPKLGNILEGVTRNTILRLAKEVGIESVEKDLYVYDLYNADEIFITNTSPTIRPVSKFNERVLPKPILGPIAQQLLSAFSELVGFDIVQHVINYVHAKRKGMRIKC